MDGFQRPSCRVTIARYKMLSSLSFDRIDIGTRESRQYSTATSVIMEILAYLVKGYFLLYLLVFSNDRGQMATVPLLHSMKYRRIGYNSKYLFFLQQINYIARAKSQ